MSRRFRCRICRGRDLLREAGALVCLKCGMPAEPEPTREPAPPPPVAVIMGVPIPPRQERDEVAASCDMTDAGVLLTLAALTMFAAALLFGVAGVFLWLTE